VPVVFPEKESDELTGQEFDVVIVGGGVIGLTVARELSRYNLSVALIERHDDLGMDQTGRCSAMIHPALTAAYGTLKWEMNFQGNPMWDELSSQLGIDFKRIGTLVVAETQEDEARLPLMIEGAKKRRETSLKLLDRAELDRVEPGLAPHIQKGVIIANAGIVNVFELVAALAENAAMNGVQFFFETSVIGVKTEDRSIKAVETTRGAIKTGLLINAAGLYSDKIAELAGDRFFTIHPRKGETIIFDQTYQPTRTILGSMTRSTDRRNQYSKGGGIIPTTDGNLQFGPTAEEVGDRDETSTSARGMDELFNRFAPMLERLKPDYEKPDRGKVITQFAGCRAATYAEDFIIEASKKIKGLIHVAGIQSPGLVSAPAIARRVRDIVVEERRPDQKTDFEPTRKRVKRFSEMDRQELEELIQSNPLYGHIICRCECASEGEIVDILRGKIPVKSIDAIKRRTRAGTGRCQGGFCMPRVLEIISREKNIAKEQVTKRGGKSFILAGKTK
ncbi:MAG: NAD(P)/FAD-dependent oxidoreductase, partial [Deltaproteobacteria bacterium]|nr:NAD(P)/FAD-dependent oxidoreductase [Deltaproteobacteria bacterium]